MVAAFVSVGAKGTSVRKVSYGTSVKARTTSCAASTSNRVLAMAAKPVTTRYATREPERHRVQASWVDSEFFSFPSFELFLTTGNLSVFPCSEQISKQLPTVEQQRSAAREMISYFKEKNAEA